MAGVSAKFEADFSQFVGEAKKANGALSEVEATAKSLEAAVKDLKSGAETLANAFGIAFTVGAAVNFVENVVGSATAMNNLSQQTHIGVEELQLLAGAMSEFGVDADTLGKGIYRLSRGIAGGDESVSRGLAIMGIALKDVAGLNGQELFLKVEAGLATLQGGLRDTAATDLFGSKLGMAMAGASEGIAGTLEKTRELNTVMSKESVKSLADFEDAMKRANTGLMAMAANMIGPLAQGFNVLNDAADKGASKWSIAKAVFLDYVDTQATGVTQTGNLTRLLDEQNQKTEENAKKTRDAAAAHGDVAKAVDTRTAAETFMATLEANAAVALTATQLAQLDHLKEIGQLNAANAALLEITPPMYAKYTASMEAAKKAAEELAKAQEYASKIATEGAALAEKAWIEYDANAASLYATDLARATIAADKKYNLAKVEAERKGIVDVNYYNALWALRDQDVQKAKVDTEALRTNSIEGLEATYQKAQATFEAMLTDGLHHSQEQIQYFRDLRDKALDALHGIPPAVAAIGTALDAVGPKIVKVKDQFGDLVNAAVEAARKAALVWNPQIDYGTVEGQAEANDPREATLNDWIAAQGVVAGTASWVKHLALVAAGKKKLHDAGVPGFEGGGPTGEGGLSFLHPGEYVVPKGGALVAGGGGTTVNILIQGSVVTERELSTRLEERLTRKILQGLKV